MLAIKKWLREQHTTTDKEEDELRILKYMNVPDLQGGFKKLWRVVGLLDSMIIRSTELQAVSLLKYDDLFLSLCRDYTPVTKKLIVTPSGAVLSEPVSTIPPSRTARSAAGGLLAISAGR